MRRLLPLLILFLFSIHAQAFNQENVQAQYESLVEQYLNSENYNVETLLTLKEKNQLEIESIKKKLGVIKEFINKDSGVALNISTYFVESCLIDNTISNDKALFVTHSMGCSFAQALLLYFSTEIVIGIVHHWTPVKYSLSTYKWANKFANRFMAVAMAYAFADILFKAGYNLVADKDVVYYRNKINKHIRGLDKSVVREFLNARINELIENLATLTLQNKAVDRVIHLKAKKVLN